MSKPPFDGAEIRALAAILIETGLTEIEIEENGRRIRVVRAPGVTSVQASVAATTSPSPVTPASATQADEDSDHPGAVTSPMVGIVYLSPEPGAPPFVTVGQAVAAGQTLMLIEAMKTFNQIKAPSAGTVARILVSAGSPVEYDQVLMVIE